MNVRTIDDVNRALAADLIWRKKELSTIRLVLERQRSPAFLRSWVALLYAHWEGAVRAASQIYLEYVQSPALKVRRTFPQTSSPSRSAANSGARPTAIGFGCIWKRPTFSEVGFTERCALPKDAVSTRSNLSSDVLREITDSLGLDFGPLRNQITPD